MYSFKPINTELKGIGVVIDFDDCTTLILRPLMPFAPLSHGTVEDLESLVLCKDDEVKSLAFKHPSQFAGEDRRGFWSSGDSTQQQLAQYLKSGLEYSKEHKTPADLMIKKIMEYCGEFLEQLERGEYVPLKKQVPFLHVFSESQE